MVEMKNQVLQEMAKVMLHMHDNPILPIRLSLDLEQRKHPMNCKLGENQTLSILGLLAVSAIFLGMEKT